MGRGGGPGGWCPPIRQANPLGGDFPIKRMDPIPASHLGRTPLLAIFSTNRVSYRFVCGCIQTTENPIADSGTLLFIGLVAFFSSFYNRMRRIQLDLPWRG